VASSGAASSGAASSGAASSARSTDSGLLDLLTLERIEDNLFRSGVITSEPGGLYGGQVAAQALRAGAETVPAGRHAHSCHGYFLSRGDASRPVVLIVHRDRDGGSYSNRRVIAVQDGTVIFNMVASFHAGEPGFDYQAHSAPAVTPPEELPGSIAGFPLIGVEARIPEQPRPDQPWPSRAWLRARDPLPDDTLHACALTYVSDMFSGLAQVPGVTYTGPLTSIDHAVWFYRPVPLDDWVLMELQPESTAGGRGTYTGRIFGRDGRLAASIAQESLFRVSAATQDGTPG
jgi:acyl-CoA thioesterase II